MTAGSEQFPERQAPDSRRCGLMRVLSFMLYGTVMVTVLAVGAVAGAAIRLELENLDPMDRGTRMAVAEAQVLRAPGPFDELAGVGDSSDAAPRPGDQAVLTAEQREALFKSIYAPPLETAAGYLSLELEPDPSSIGSDGARPAETGKGAADFVAVAPVREVVLPLEPFEDTDAAGIEAPPTVPSETHLDPRPLLPNREAAGQRRPGGGGRTNVYTTSPNVYPMSTADLPPWRRNAVAVTPARGKPKIAIVLDDVGLNHQGARASIALPGPLTLSFMTYAPRLEPLTQAAREAGHELLVHVPMQPLDTSVDPGRNTLHGGLDAEETRRRLAWGLSRFEGYVGISNHMGSRFTADPEGMALVLEELKARGLLFLDSRTSKQTVGASLARRMGVPQAERDVFLDNAHNDPVAVRAELRRLEAVALDQGYAVGIGHPHEITLAALAEWLPGLAERGFELVPISYIAGEEETRRLQSAQR